MDSEDDNSSAYEVLIEREANAEMTEAYNWYQSKKKGLGSEFLRALNERLTAIERTPTSYPVVHEHGSRHLRRALLRRFPYSLIYFIEGQVIIVIACFHGSRDPKDWQRRGDDTDTNNSE
jgi:plasmid stabilization system protein ParE